MITINKWWDQFENAGSRKLVTIRHFSSTAGNDSRGYRKLMRMGVGGLTAFGAFQALCQLMASLGIEARKSGSTINSDGSPLEIIDLSDLTRIPTKTLSSNIDILVSVGWVSMMKPLEIQQSATDLPSSPTDLPLISQDMPNGEERRGEDRREEDTMSSADDDKQSLESQFIEAWNQLPEPIMKIRGKVQKANRAAFNARSKDPHFIENWREALESIPDDDHCMCRTEGSSWIATVSYFLQADTINKLLSRKAAREYKKNHKPKPKTFNLMGT